MENDDIKIGDEGYFWSFDIPWREDQLHKSKLVAIHEDHGFYKESETPDELGNIHFRFFSKTKPILNTKSSAYFL